jgi:imidazolonepropionase-like amidohydrolase
MRTIKADGADREVGVTSGIAVATLLTALTALSAPTALTAQTIAITGGTVFPVSSPKIENGTVLIQGSKILAIGPDLPIPAGAKVIDARGRWVTPGLFHAASSIGLTLFESGGQLETAERRKTGDVNAAFNVAEGINPQALSLPTDRMEGITTVLATPTGGLLAGQAVAIDLNGERIEDLLVKSPAAMVLDLSQASKPAGGGSRAGVLQRLRQLFADALDYSRRKADYQRAQMQTLSAPAADLAALGPVLSGVLPLYVIANRRSDIESALRLAKEYKLRIVIYGGVEAWQVAPELAAAKVPVIVQPLADIPSFDGLGARLDNAARLSRAGVTVILAQPDDQAFGRDLRFAAGNAVSYGMDWEAALRAITLTPAQVFGVTTRYGSLQPGKVANVVIWTGDPFEFSSQAERVFIRGVDIPLVSRQTELLERYRSLPPE